MSATDTSPKPEKPGKEYERIVAAIHRQFAGDAKVTENETITGKSGQPRQIDVAVHSSINGAYPLLIILECKDYKRPVGIGQIDELVGKIDDVGAITGVLVSNSGFTEDAVKRAKQDVRIQLASVVDVENEKVRTRLAIPVICDYRAPEMRFTVNVSAMRQFVMDEALMTEIKRKFIELWNNGGLEDELGDHHHTETFRNERDLNVTVTYEYRVKRRLFYGPVKLIRTQGILNVTQDTYQTSHFTTDMIDAVDVEQNWQRVDENNTPFAVIIMMARDMFPVPA